MKQLFLPLMLLFCCWFTACNNQDADQKNLSVNRDLFQAMESGDTSKLSSSIADDAVDHAGPGGFEVSNGDSIRAYLADMHNHVKDLKFDIMGEASNGDYVYTWAKMTGTALDSSMGFPAGQPMNLSFVDLIKYRDGKAVEHWSFIDQHDLAMQRAAQQPGATTVKVVMGDSSNAAKDTAANK